MAIQEGSSTDYNDLLQSIVIEHGYPQDDELLGYLTQMMLRLNAAVPITDWAGKKVLDVACGNKAPADPIEDRIRAVVFASEPSAKWLHELGLKCRQPWLCRILSGLGAEVTGVDWKYPRYEQIDGKWQGCTESGWHFIEQDLSAVGAMSSSTGFPPNYYDVVYCKDFLGEAAVAAPEMMTLRDRNSAAYKSIESNILMQCARVLKPDGIFVWNEKPFHRNGRRFLPLNRN